MNRAWAYIISKPLSDSQLTELKTAGKNFVKSWTAHENQLSADFQVFKQKIILVSVDEDVTNASGCSIDKLMRFIKDSEARFGIELLNRFMVAYKNGEEVEVVHSTKVKELFSQHQISENTIVYNTSIATAEELNNWEIPLKETWLNKYLTKV